MILSNKVAIIGRKDTHDYCWIVLSSFIELYHHKETTVKELQFN